MSHVLEMNLRELKEITDGHDALIEQEFANYCTRVYVAHKKYNPTGSSIPVVS
jgi:hypothetical protein